MDLEVTVVLKQYAVVLRAGNGMGYPVRAKIVKLVGEPDEHCWYEVSSYFKENFTSEPYTSGGASNSIDDAEYKLMQYLQKFQYALLNGGNVVANPSYIG